MTLFRTKSGAEPPVPSAYEGRCDTAPDVPAIAVAASAALVHGGVVVRGDDVDAPDYLLRGALRAGTVGRRRSFGSCGPDAPARFSRRAEAELRVAGWFPGRKVDVGNWRKRWKPVARFACTPRPRGSSASSAA